MTWRGSRAKTRMRKLLDEVVQVRDETTEMVDDSYLKSCTQSTSGALMWTKRMLSISSTLGFAQS